MSREPRLGATQSQGREMGPIILQALTSLAWVVGPRARVHVTYCLKVNISQPTRSKLFSDVKQPWHWNFSIKHIWMILDEIRKKSLSVILSQVGPCCQWHVSPPRVDPIMSHWRWSWLLSWFVNIQTSTRNPFESLSGRKYIRCLCCAPWCHWGRPGTWHRVQAVPAASLGQFSHGQEL